MTFDLQQVLNSSLSLRIVSWLAQQLPPRIGYRFAYGLAGQIARRRDAQVVRALRANQWIVHGESLQGEALDQRVLETLRYSAHFLFDLYHYSHAFEATRELIVFDSSFQEIAQRTEFDRRGLVVAGLHLSNFDLILQWLSRAGMKLLVLTIPDPQGGRRVEYELRKKTGMHLLPASVSAFRQALRHLQKGGMVLTGVDRPIDNPELQPCFFGHPAALPMHHIFLAVKARVPIIITAAYLQRDGKYHVFASEPIEMDYRPDANRTLLRNAEKVLAVAEEFIRRAPQQWSVPLSVWPQRMDLVPK